MVHLPWRKYLVSLKNISKYTPEPRYVLPSTAIIVIIIFNKSRFFLVTLRLQDDNVELPSKKNNDWSALVGLPFDQVELTILRFLKSFFNYIDWNPFDSRQTVRVGSAATLFLYLEYHYKKKKHLSAVYGLKSIRIIVFTLFPWISTYERPRESLIHTYEFSISFKVFGDLSIYWNIVSFKSIQ